MEGWVEALWAELVEDGVVLTEMLLEDILI